ncbi:LCP family protein [Amycolatopsis sp. NPDC049252]|uniref:LCP family protein n=1 Tax=Amycolatopsis sp. NPDC049252 TaxID=3363933 RepID=UPI0037106DB6
MDHPPRNGQGGRRPARPWQDEPGRAGARRGTPPPRRPAPRREPVDARRVEPQRRPPARARRNSFRGAKIALTVVSLLVMGLTGYAWAAMQGLVNGLNYANVISDGGGGDKPADGARDILLVGLDSRTDAQGNPLSREVLDELRAGESDGELNTDSLIFVHIPNDGSKAVAISLPRDTYVDIPGGYGKHKINSAYARAMLSARKDLQKQGVTDPKQLDVQANQAGAKELIQTVEKLTGSTIDNYAAVNLLGFSDITKAIGGVDVCLNNTVKDQYSGANFTKGQHTISGVEALEFVRQRHGLPNGDLDRVVRQQVFMAGMARKVLSAGTLTNPGKLTDLIDAIKKSVVLNQNWDIFGFAQQMKGLTGGQLEFRTIPVKNVDYKTPEDGSAIQVDPTEVKDFVQGLAGPQPGQPAPPADQADSANKATTVDVRNASGKTGLAATVAKTLSAKGFTSGDTANATSRKTTVIWVPKGGKDTGQKVADALGGSPTIQEDKSVQAGHVTVFLGANYQPPSTDSNAGSSAGGATSQAPAPPPADAEKPITAEGVPCVN